MAPPPSQKTMTTWAANSKHPTVDVGIAAPKKKCQTVVEVQRDKEDKAAQATIAKKARKDKVQRVAEMEDRMTVEESTMDITPHPWCPLPQSHVDLQCTEMYVDASLSLTEAMEVSDLTSEGDFAHASEGVGDTKLKEDARPPAVKKVKVSKPHVHEEVEKAHKPNGSDGKEKRDTNRSTEAEHHMRPKVSSD